MKTAMQELVEWIDSTGWAGTRVSQKAQELLEKEKQQIIEAYTKGHSFHDTNDETSAEFYYDKTYPK